MNTADREYHLQELRIAQDAGDKRRILPPILPSDSAILDVGCGAGQTLIASDLAPEQRAVGVDVDHEALVLGRKLTDRVLFLQAYAEELPFPDEAFDLVISRVTLPLTELRRSVPEVTRVLKPGGRCWLVLHPITYPLRHLLANAARGKVKGVIFHFYALLNGLSLHFFDRQFAFPKKSGPVYESFQTQRAIRRLLLRAGMADIEVRRQHHFQVTARKLAAPRRGSAGG